MRLRIPLIVTIAICLGCSSLQTMPLSRTEDDTLFKDQEKPLKGIPVMVKIPSHVELTAYEISYYHYQPGSDPSTTPQVFNQITTPASVRDFTYVVKQTDKMFIVDPVRPAAGAGGFGFLFADPSSTGYTDANGAAGSAAGHGYMKGFNYRAVDQTILQSSALLTNALNIVRGKAPVAPSLTANTGSATGNPFDNVITVKRPIAFCTLDISDPCFEAKVNQFLTDNVNCVVQ